MFASAIHADAQVIKRVVRSRHAAKEIFIPRNNVLTTHFGVGYIAGYPGVNGVLEYERFVDHAGLFSVTVAGGAYNSGTFTSGSFRDGSIRTTQYGSFIAPGIRFHPFRNKRKTDVAIGLSVPLGSSVCTDRYRINHYTIEPVSNRSSLGAIQGQFHVNFRKIHGFVFGLFLNAGCFYSMAVHPLSSEANRNGFIVVGLKMGGQW